MIPGFGPGQGIVSGQVVRFPLPVKVRMDEDLLSSEIGDENFFEQVSAWRQDPNAATRAAAEASSTRVDEIRQRRQPSGTTATSPEPVPPKRHGRPAKKKPGRPPQKR